MTATSQAEAVTFHTSADSPSLEVAPGSRLRYLDVGKGRPVLLLHGNPTWSYLWRNLVRDLVEEGRRCIVIDHLGCGYSDKPQDFSYCLENHIANCLLLVELLGLEDCDMVVHDWGGAIGMGVATWAPERFRRFLITNTAAFPFRRIPWRIAACRLPVAGTMAVRGLSAFSWGFVRMATRRRMAPEVRAAYLQPYQSWNNRIAVHRFVQDIPMSSGHRSWSTLCRIAEELPRLRSQPVHLLWGMRDWCFTPAFLAEWQRRFPEAETTRLDEAAHLVFEDLPAEATGVARDFLGL